MSDKIVSSSHSQNSEMLRQIASRLLKAPSTLLQNGRIVHLDDLVNRIVDERHPLTIPVKIDSRTELNLADHHDCPSSSCQESLPGDLWVFGYGSLVWKADFPYACRQTGFIKGFNRRFYQNSIDHRGTLENPGRVVTLIPSQDSDSRVWGVAYRIAAAKREEVIKHLDFREKNGYERHNVAFYPYSRNQRTPLDPFEIVVYVATEQNDSYAGHIDNVNDIARQVFWAVGPSGTNREYVYKLANAMRQLFPGEKDEHLFELERKVREREAVAVEMNEKIREEIKAIISKAVDTQVENLDILEEEIASKFEEFDESRRKL